MGEAVQRLTEDLGEGRALAPAAARPFGSVGMVAAIAS
jgi:hypothetical protein